MCQASYQALRYNHKQERRSMFSRSSVQQGRLTRSADNLNWVPRTNPESPVLYESLEMKQRGPTQRGSIFSLLDSGIPPDILPDLHRYLAEGRHTWQCLGAWLGCQSPSLDDVHFELTIPLLQADLHVPCKSRQDETGKQLQA